MKLGRRVVGSTSLALAAGAVLGGLLLGPGSRLSPGQVLIWVALAAGLGVLASWEERITPLPAGHDPVTDEAAVLLARLSTWCRPDCSNSGRDRVCRRRLVA